MKLSPIKTTDMEITIQDQIITALSGIDNANQEMVKDQFANFIAEIDDLQEQAAQLIVESEDETYKMQQAREARLAVRSLRVATEKRRKELKEESLRYGRALDGVAGVIKSRLEPIEEHFRRQEDYIKIQEQIKNDALKLERSVALDGLEGFYPSVDLTELSEADFQMILSAAETAKQKFEAEQEEELQRIEQERIERERLISAAAAIEKENNRLRDQIEKEAAEKSRKDAIEAAEQERQAAAPDKEKFAKFAEMLDKLALPEMATPAGQNLRAEVHVLLGKVSGHIRGKMKIE